VDEALGEAARRLGAAGVEDARLDAERLLRHVSGWDRATLLARGRDPLSDGLMETLDALVGERARRRPLQHLLGTQAFWRHEFVVTPDVLIPRPETELLVEHGLAAIAGRRGPAVVDVGTGTGCVALSLAAEREDAEVHATDVSEAALAVARANALRLGLPDRVRFHRGDLLAPVASRAGGFDLIVSNPPYVDASEHAGLAPEVRDHEPRLALTPDEGPASLYRRLFEQARPVLAREGVLAVEIGASQEAMARAAAEGAGLEVRQVLADLQGLPRVVVLRRPGGW
jgi:release factor glutamine methyltransferase